MFSLEVLWKAFGLFGQFLFGGRFVLQWFASERMKKSIIPDSFWVLSILGGVVLFIYALHIQDPVFIIGQGLGLVIYARNIYFVFRGRRKDLVE